MNREVHPFFRVRYAAFLCFLRNLSVDIPTVGMFGSQAGYKMFPRWECSAQASSY